MLGKRIASFKNLAKKVKSINTTTRSGGEGGSESTHNESLLMSEAEEAAMATTKTPTGTFAVYVGEERVKRVVPTSYLNHPLFRMLLDKSHDEFLCSEQKVMLVVPCSLSVFQDVVNAVESCNGNFDFGDFVEEFL
ncbi:PREDICTED: auxin-responsive protein SAUR15-like [Camelina sativa]|uniref:Auxin-responsive protein SAUR15-like n=1 Tax=Camelina sativa TaxID=90675 RepID=A0ABM0YS98_CAMSA|nr:PREDICTED: auxin-responsive protein SAUR15-like [Camelina sativa]